MRKILEFPAVIYKAAFMGMLKKDNTPFNQGCAVLNFLILNFWIVYFGLRPFTGWELSTMGWAIIAIVNMGVLVTSMIVNTIETRRYIRELREADQRIHERLQEIKDKYDPD